MEDTRWFTHKKVQVLSTSTAVGQATARFKGILASQVWLSLQLQWLGDSCVLEKWKKKTTPLQKKHGSGNSVFWWEVGKNKPKMLIGEFLDCFTAFDFSKQRRNSASQGWPSSTSVHKVGIASWGCWQTAPNADHFRDFFGESHGFKASKVLPRRG